MADTYIPRFKKQYDETIAKAMTEKFGYANAMEIPRIEKITLNMGVGDAKQDSNVLDAAARSVSRRGMVVVASAA